MQVQESVTVQKEELALLNFYPSEVLSNQEEIAHRTRELYKGMILGNAHHYKVKIFFQTIEGERSVETTIWFATDKFVMLKGDMTLPVRCISRVIL